MIKNFEYDEEQHRYYVGGVEVPSVTTIKDHFIPSFYNSNNSNYACDLGKRVHKATELYDQGILDEDSIADDVRVRLQAWDEFKTIYQWENIMIERAMCISFEPYMSLAGRFDRVGSSKVSLGKLPGVNPLDVKVSDGHIKGVEIQLAMYSILYDYNRISDEHPPSGARVAVYLRSDGRFKASRDLKVYDDPMDVVIAKQMITTYNWMVSKGYLNK